MSLLFCFKMNTVVSCRGTLNLFLRLKLITNSHVKFMSSLSASETQAHERIRNIGIFADKASGKDTLIERMLFYNDRKAQIHKVKDKGEATMDSMELEHQPNIVVQSAASNTLWKDHNIYIVTPSYWDFTDKVERTIRCVDGAIYLLSSVKRVNIESLQVNGLMRRCNVPCVAFMNHVDYLGSNPTFNVTLLREMLKYNAACVHFSIGLQDKFKGIVDLVHQRAIYFVGEYGEDIRYDDVPYDIRDKVGDMHQELIKAVSNVDHSLKEILKEDKTPTKQEISDAIRRSCLKRTFMPVFLGTALHKGPVQLLLDGIIDYLPSPNEVVKADLRENEGATSSTSAAYADVHADTADASSEHVRLRSASSANIFSQDPTDDYANSRDEVSEYSNVDGLIVKVQGLPWTARAADIVDFFSGCNIKNGKQGIQITTNWRGKPSGEAYIEMMSLEDVEKACKKDGKYLGHRYIDVRKSNRSEMERMVKNSGLFVEDAGDDSLVKVSNLPVGCTKDEIVFFFQGLEIIPNGITILLNERSKTPTAYVQFVSKETTEKALLKHREKMEERCVPVVRSSRNEMCVAMNRKTETQRASTKHVRGGGLNLFNTASGGDDGNRNHEDLSSKDDASYVNASKDNKDHCVRMAGLPYVTTREDIENFFSPIVPTEIHLRYTSDGRCSGIAVVKFASHEDAVKSMSKHKSYIGHRYIVLVLRSSPS